MEPEFVADRGLLRLTTNQIEGLVRGDRELLDDSVLRSIGVVGPSGLDPALGPMLETLRRPACRFGLRVEQADDVARHRGWVGRGGVVVLTGSSGPDDVMDIHAVPRPASLARALALLLDLDPRARRSDVSALGPAVEMERLRNLVKCRHDWASGSTRTARILHLRWSSDAASVAKTIMVLVDLGTAGVVEARPQPDGLFLPVPRAPIEVWTALTALARHAAEAT